MGLSTERKVFVAILAIAGAALVLDRGLLGPSSASASSEAVASPPTPENEGLAPLSTQENSQSAAQILIQRLTKPSEETLETPRSSLGSAFSLERLVEPVVEPSPEPGGNEAAPITGNESQQRPTLPILVPSTIALPTLTAVMPASNGGGAVLDGKLVRTGQEGPDGFVLKQVRQRGVVLERDGRLYTIEIPVHAGP